MFLLEVYNVANAFFKNKIHINIKKLLHYNFVSLILSGSRNSKSIFLLESFF